MSSVEFDLIASADVGTTSDFPKKSLAYLLARYCDFTADKRYQLADWRIRPLPEEMLAYARSDTHSLLYIYDNLRDELLQLGDGKPDAIRTVLQNSATTALNVYQHEQFSKEGAHVLARKWNKGFYGKPLAIFETLYEWRDQIARLEDENPRQVTISTLDCTASTDDLVRRYVLPNHFLFPLAERPPKDVPGLLSAIQPTPPLVRSHASELIETIRAAVIVFTKESALKAKAKTDFGAMDVDSGPFANVVPTEAEGDTPPVGEGAFVVLRLVPRLISFNFRVGFGCDLQHLSVIFRRLGLRCIFGVGEFFLRDRRCHSAGNL